MAVLTAFWFFIMLWEGGFKNVYLTLSHQVFGFCFVFNDPLILLRVNSLQKVPYTPFFRGNQYSRKDHSRFYFQVDYYID